VAGERLLNDNRVCGRGRARVGRGAPDVGERRVTAHEGRVPLFTELPRGLVFSEPADNVHSRKHPLPLGRANKLDALAMASY
jgi:hypothetical protein